MAVTKVQLYIYALILSIIVQENHLHVFTAQDELDESNFGLNIFFIYI